MLNDRSASSKETLSNGAVRQDGILSQVEHLKNFFLTSCFGSLFFLFIEA